MRHRALPERVQAAPVKVVTRAFHVRGARIIGRYHDALVQILGLIGVHAGSAQPVLEQTGDL